MTEQNVYHVHKKLTDELDLVSVPKNVVARIEEHMRYFSN